MAIYKLRKVLAKNIQCLVLWQREASVSSDVNIWTPISLLASFMPCVCVRACTKLLQLCSAGGFFTTSAIWKDLFMLHSLFFICFIFLILSFFFFWNTIAFHCCVSFYCCSPRCIFICCLKFFLGLQMILVGK